MASTEVSKTFSLGSNPRWPTMGTIFKHNGKLIQCRNLKKKLKKLRINENDIEILYDNIADDDLDRIFFSIGKENVSDDGEAISLYVFSDGVNTIYSIYSDLDHLGINHEGFKYVKCIMCYV